MHTMELQLQRQQQQQRRCLSSDSSASESTAPTLSTPPPFSPIPYHQRNIYVDRWEPCTGNLSIAEFLTGTFLVNCPSFGACHKRWAALGFPDIDVSHWPRFDSALFPTNFNELLPAYNQATALFLDRVSSFWHGRPTPEMTLQQMAPFVLLEVVCTADLTVAEREQEHGALNEQARLFLWEQTVSHRISLLAHQTRWVIDQCVHRASETCILRVSFGEVHDNQSYCERHFCDLIQSLQLRMPNFRTKTIDAAHAEGPLSWYLPTFDLPIRQEQLQPGPAMASRKRKRVSLGGWQNDISHRSPKRQEHVEVIHRPSRVDLFDMLSNAAGTTTSTRFAEIHDGDMPPTLLPSTVANWSSPILGPPGASWPPSSPDVATLPVTLGQPTPGIGLPETSMPSIVSLPAVPLEPNPLPFFPSAAIIEAEDVKPLLAAASGSVVAMAMPLPTPAATVTATPTSTPPPPPSTAKARAEQSRLKMQRYAARVKKQREALVTVYEDMENALQRMPGAAALLSQLSSTNGTSNSSSSSASPEQVTFASAAEKLNYQKRQSKARKRAGESTHVDSISLRSKQALQLPFVHPMRRAIEDALVRHRETWIDLIEAEKRLKSGGAAAITASKRQKKSGGSVVAKEGGRELDEGQREGEGTPVRDLIQMLEGGPQPGWTA